MKDLRLARLITLIIVSVALCKVSLAQGPKCDEIHAMAAMARANSSTALISWKQKAGDSYRAKVVFASRSFELDPSGRRAASGLLDLMPHNEEVGIPHDEDEGVWHDLGDSFCDAESTSDMTALGRLGDRLPHDLARAVLLMPEWMPAYVFYGGISIGDPHSDYAERMEPVCRAMHKEFLDAVDKFSSKDKKWFVSTVFDPKTCRAIAHPEAD